MTESASASPSPSSYYDSPCPCCGNKKRRLLSSSNSPSPTSSCPPDIPTSNKRMKHRPPISPSSLTSSMSPSFSFPPRSDYSPAPSMSLPPSVKNKFSFVSNSSSSSSQLNISDLDQSLSQIRSREKKLEMNTVATPPEWKKIEEQAVISSREVTSEAVTVPQVLKNEHHAVISPQENETDAVKVPQAVEKGYDAVTSPREEKAEAVMKSDDKGEEAVILQEEKKVLEEVITPQENKTVTASQLNCDCCDNGLSPKHTVTGKNGIEEIRIGLKCKCGIFREIIIT